jgi:uncharacterized protein YqhQ
MMKNKTQYAVAVRKPDGEIEVHTSVHEGIAGKSGWAKLPLIRGVVNLIEMFILSFSTLTASTEMMGLEEELHSEEPSKFEKWLEKHFGKNLMNVVSGVAMVLGILLAMGLFIALPAFVTNLIFPDELDGDFWMNRLKCLVEGVLKVLIFIGYLYFTSLMKEIRRVYMYHGAEHKTIFCYEAGLELTVENVRKQSRFHPRCGTSFMFVMVFLSIIVSIAFIPNVWGWLRVLLKLLLLPVCVGLGYEFIRFAGKHDNAFVRFLAAPGLWMQRITTREPDDDMIEVAIVATKSALHEEFAEFEIPYESEYLKKKEEAKKTEEEANAGEGIQNETP